MSERTGKSSAKKAAQKRPTSTKTAPSTRAKARDGKKAVVGYFSPAVNLALKKISVDEATTIQALVGEAIDMLLEDRGLEAAGER